MRRLLGFALSLLAGPCLAAVTLPLGSATVTIGDDGKVGPVVCAGREATPAATEPAFLVETDRGLLRPTRVERAGGELVVTFGDQGRVRFALTVGQGFFVLKLTDLNVPGTVRRLQVFAQPVPQGGTTASWLNGWYDDQFATAVFPTAVNVMASPSGGAASSGDNADCSHRFERVTDLVKEGGAAARFTCTSQREDRNGWSWGRWPLPAPLDLTGLAAIRAWVYGDAGGELLKIQLRDSDNHARDAYVAIDFTGWRQVTIDRADYDTLRYDRVTSVDLYYNGVAAKKTVSVVIDDIEALVGQGAAQRVVPLADFEAAEAPLWSPLGWVKHLVGQTTAQHGIRPAGVAVVACPRAEFEEAIARCERAAGLPSPRPGGVWGKRSPASRHSYMLSFYLTEADVDDTIRFAKRAGLDTILIFQIGNSWCNGTGHYEIDRKAWPRGLDSLADATAKIHRAGLKVGLHYLGASIYPPDKFVTPVPDPRLVRDAFGELAADLDATTADFIPLAAPPIGFPDIDVDYLGSGAVVQIGDELIHYTTTSMEPPYGLKGCSRGWHGTLAAPHAKGDRVAHMMRSYGYYLYDMDTPILGDVADNVTRVLNACHVDMVYWDGSEQLQGDHWYYNAKLQNAFFERLRNQDIVCQGSSMSPYSWHIHARYASADGHGDLKGYLDERRPGFRSYRDNLMPVDIGWYSVFDISHTLDEFEYILNKSLGYNASISFGASPDMLRRHPFLWAIADRIAAYERTRAAVETPAATCQVLQAPERREYRLVGEGKAAQLQRVLYEPRHDVVDYQGGTDTWEVEVKDAPCRLAVEPTALDRRAGAGPSYRAPQAVMLEDFASLQPYAGDDARLDTMVIGEGKAGMAKEGTTQRFELLDGAPGGGKYALYTAVNSAGEGGWSAMGRALTQAVDFSQQWGVGFWLRGD
ncbi:MAG: hypothetical protein HYU66_02255, partial [Armatimonadetes bacterium]|nr:hypothetical protein [Armatimonadota bacterium]